MATKRVMRETRTVLLVPIYENNLGEVTLLSPSLSDALTGSTPFTAPTSTLLNLWAAITAQSSNNPSMGGNISPSILDNINLGLGQSERNQLIRMISVGNESYKIAETVNAVLEFLDDADRYATGNWNFTRALTRTAGARYAIVDRTQDGKKWSAPFAPGDVVSLYLAGTDHPVDNVRDKDWTSRTQNFVPDGRVVPNYTLLA